MKKALILVLLLFAVPAWGQQPQRRPLTGNIPADIRNALSPTVPREVQSLSTFLADLADIQGAIDLATQIPELQDPVGLACWQQFHGIGELIKAHPLPATLKIASDWEAFRLLAIGMNQVCANPNCGQMFVDATNAVGALAPISLPISLQSICQHIPVIGTNAVPMPKPRPEG